MLQFISHATPTISCIEGISLALSGGCKWIQLRMKGVPDDEVRPIALQVKKMCKEAGATFIIDDRVALVKELNADGVHLGKKQLFRGVVTAHFRTWNQEIARKCQAAEEEAGRENGRDDIIFWKLLYQINPKLKGFYWMGQTYESLPAFGRDVLERLWDKDKSQYPYYSTVLSEKLLSQYVTMAAPKNEKLKRAAEAIEDSYELEKNNGTDMQRTYYLMAYTLSGQKLLLLDGEQIRTVGELANYMRSVLAESFDKFESLCHRLVDYDGNLDFQLETWLMAIGKQKELEKWRESMNE